MLILDSLFTDKTDENSMNPYKRLYKIENKLIQMTCALTTIFTMTASATYHTFNCISDEYARLCLRIDLVGIGIMIFSNTLILVHAGYQAYKDIRNEIMGSMLVLFFCNSCL